MIFFLHNAVKCKQSMFQTYGFICHACKEAAKMKTTFGEKFQSDSLDLTPKSSESESSLNVANLTANIW